MKEIKAMVKGREVTFEELDVLDLLSEKRYFKTKFRRSFNEIFSGIIYSYTKFNLYIYKLYKRELRGLYLAKWIVGQFIILLERDLIYGHHTFKFPYRETYLSVKDANLFKKVKRYKPKYYGKLYRLFFQSQNKDYFYCGLQKQHFSKLRKHGITNPYV